MLLVYRLKRIRERIVFCGSLTFMVIGKSHSILRRLLHHLQQALVRLRHPLHQDLSLLQTSRQLELQRHRRQTECQLLLCLYTVSLVSTITRSSNATASLRTCFDTSSSETNHRQRLCTHNTTSNCASRCMLFLISADVGDATTHIPGATATLVILPMWSQDIFVR